MWTSPRGKNNSSDLGVFCSPSKSSSTCSSPSPFSPSPPSPNLAVSARKSMEEVWKDINLSSLEDHANSTNKPNDSVFPSMILQDFFASAFAKDPPSTRVVASAAEPSSGGTTATLFSDSFGPPPATVLSLNSASDLSYIESMTVPMRPNPQLQTRASACLPSPFGTSLQSGSDAQGFFPVFPSDSKKRPQENDGNSGDQRHKRMIKNRESAARSRARKQAYTYELELEVAHLLEENDKLRRQQQRLLATPAHQPKKNTLYRTLTAPF